MQYDLFEIGSSLLVRDKFAGLEFANPCPNYPVFLSYKHYELKTVDNRIELMQALKLRHDVFGSEMGACFGNELDYDEYDQSADLLIIKDTKKDIVIGTYRMISSKYSKKFYSEEQYNLKEFKKSDAHKIELSRACIHPDYRNGIVLGVLWKGIVEYATKSNSKYLFGVSSVWTDSEPLAKGIYRVFEESGQIGNDFSVEPRGPYRLKNFESGLAYPKQESSKHVPSLLRAYLKAGAKVYGEPTFDSDFKTMDFFTVLNLEELTSNFKRKYAS